MIQSGEIKGPVEFRIALYENLVKQLEKKGKFQHVDRDGDSSASAAPTYSSQFNSRLQRPQRASQTSYHC
jgi:hypothetical protein